eukprot:GFYU01005217.1.p1 GENE.GFYU01005217.1~~GFYU01005217.1.p1  ORF type:complete len:397 (+),score=100.36 GFYU01005217.1:46-1236(+)
MRLSSVVVWNALCCLLLAPIVANAIVVLTENSPTAGAAADRPCVPIPRRCCRPTKIHGTGALRGASALVQQDAQLKCPCEGCNSGIDLAGCGAGPGACNADIDELNAVDPEAMGCSCHPGCGLQDKIRAQLEDCQDDPAQRCKQLQCLKKRIQTRRRARMCREKAIENAEQEAILMLKYGVKPNDPCGCPCDKPGGADAGDCGTVKELHGCLDDDEVMKTDCLRAQLEREDCANLVDEANCKGGCGGGCGGDLSCLPARCGTLQDCGIPGVGGCGGALTTGGKACASCTCAGACPCDPENIRRRIEVENAVDKALKQRECSRKCQIQSMRNAEECDACRVKQIMKMAKAQECQDRMCDEAAGLIPGPDKEMTHRMEKAMKIGLKALKKEAECGCQK